MGKKGNGSDGLRRRAEQVLGGRELKDLDELSPAETQAVLHELYVHQIELEMQNDELRRAQEELAASRERYLELYDLAPVGYFSLDRQEIITQANLTLAGLLGVERKLLIGRSLSNFILKEDQDTYYLHRRQLVENQKPQLFELRLLKRDGSHFWAQMESLLARDDAGQVVYHSTVSDVSERVWAQYRLKEHSERLEDMVKERTQELHDAQSEVLRQQKLAALGQLAGGVAHELRNPLGSISNSAYFLNMVLTDVEPEAQQALTILETEVNACSKIINSLLDFARVKLPERRAMQINTVLRAALSRVGVPDSVQVDYQVGEGLPTIMADHGQLELVFGNLILNAVQAMTLSSSVSVRSGNGAESPGGGRLLITAKVTPDAQWLAVSINDTGVGIPGENLDNLFEPFFSTKAKGIGLGLALTKNLVEMHGGSIEAQSQLGQGSTFSVRLPLAPL